MCNHNNATGWVMSVPVFCTFLEIYEYFIKTRPIYTLANKVIQLYFKCVFCRFMDFMMNVLKSMVQLQSGDTAQKYLII